MAGNYGWWCHFFFCCPLKMTARVNKSLGRGVHSPADIWSGLHWSSCHSAMFCSQSLNPGGRNRLSCTQVTPHPPGDIVPLPAWHCVPPQPNNMATFRLPSSEVSRNKFACREQSTPDLLTLQTGGVVRGVTPVCVLWPCIRRQVEKQKVRPGWMIFSLKVLMPELCFEQKTENTLRKLWAIN